MLNRLESIRALGRAADALTAACAAQPKTFRQAVTGGALTAPLPADFDSLLSAIDATDMRRGKRHGQRH